jgi:hypothetical protein
LQPDYSHGSPDNSGRHAVPCPPQPRPGGRWPQWSAILALADQKAGYDLGFINKAAYHIGQANSHYSVSFFDITSGNNSAFGVPGFGAGPGWDPATGLGSPTADQLVDYLIQFVSPGDGTSAVAESKPHDNGNPSGPGQLRPH